MKKKKSMADPFRGLEDQMSELVLKWWRIHRSKLEQNDSGRWTEIPETDRQQMLLSLAQVILNRQASDDSPDPADMFIYGVLSQRLLLTKKREEVAEAVRKLELAGRLLPGEFFELLEVMAITNAIAPDRIRERIEQALGDLGQIWQHVHDLRVEANSAGKTLKSAVDEFEQHLRSMLELIEDIG